MRHVETSTIRAFLAGLGAGTPGRPSREPVLQHLLRCQTCLKKLERLSKEHGSMNRINLYPETDCLADSELRLMTKDPSKVEAHISHVKGCLWCALAFHDHLGSSRDELGDGNRIQVAKLIAQVWMRSSVLSGRKGILPKNSSACPENARSW